VYFFDPFYMMMIAPALLLGFYAQWRVKATYAKANQTPARLSGAAAARLLLDADGLQSVGIEQIPGKLSDHYDPRSKVLRLSPEVYNGRTMAAVGIAAHEAGHALQDAHSYAPLVVRNLAVPVANFGSSAAMAMFIGGMVLNSMQVAFGSTLFLLGIILFSAGVIFQIVNLPVEFNASSRAKALLVDHSIVPRDEMYHVNKVLNAAALTYVAATLQAILTLLYYVIRYMGSRD
jgi:Zn-dependent membrane protease YugP